ncbi:LytTR family DNA-binding domain-containing protein [Opitutus sp. ER46]|uniref:LytR/AlgR family response regulator transcription factor n=1 Tax=Opitutus sp. ER46 TaxID=2161864 RepID=UPI000D2F63BB|nr:LytTR family DNA-binding domain-containing protein [Opitutus sp. ER46]PTX91607.1 DNA-binding response regulator [Opitutus sp. ER46]
MNLTAILVDDEPLARERVRTLLAAEPDITLLAECANGPEAVAACRRQAPDLLFLDVQMPEMDGFAVLRALGTPLPLVIFTTAFDEHAVRAFEAQALDYLLKPFKPARFKAAVARAREQLSHRQPEAITRQLLSLLETRSEAPATHVTRLAVRDRDRVRFVKTSEIDWLEASGNYIVIHAGRENHVLRETLTALESQLSPKEFLRLSRSAMVNLDRIRQVEPAFNNEHVVVLTDGTRLPLTRGLRELQDRLRFS